MTVVESLTKSIFKASNLLNRLIRSNALILYKKSLYKRNKYDYGSIQRVAACTTNLHVLTPNLPILPLLVLDFGTCGLLGICESESIPVKMIHKVCPYQHKYLRSLLSPPCTSSRQETT